MKQNKTTNNASITFTWDNVNSSPKVDQNNITNLNINDVFALAAENLISKDPKNYEKLAIQLNSIYNFFYNCNNEIIN